MPLTLLSALSALLLAVVHLFAGRLDALRGSPRSQWLSLGGGVAVAYVFVHLIPELAELQRKVEEKMPSNWYWKHHLYLVGVLGLSLFYGMESAAKRTRRKDSSGTERSAAWVFWTHMPVMTAYMAFVGYILVQKETFHGSQLLVASVVFALHVAGNDRALEDDYKGLYNRIGRWLLAGAVLAGWLLGYAWKLPELTYGIVLAVVAGGITFNAIKEELPSDRSSRFWPFFAGMVASALSLAVVSR